MVRLKYVKGVGAMITWSAEARLAVLGLVHTVCKQLG